MTKIIGQYILVDKIYDSANTLVYRSVREGDLQPFILKILKQDYPTLENLARYKQEYEITRNLDLDGVIKVYALQEYQRSLMIVTEDYGALSLKELMNQSRLFAQVQNDRQRISEFLELAIKISDILGRIHSAKVIHKDINPSNIVLNPETKKVKIIDFGLSTIFTRENPTFKHPNILEGTLAYISPEQTGRMNCTLDYRTDFYSLGVTFYELLTRQLPFNINDAVELIHCHIAKQPVSVYQLAKKNKTSLLPPIISDIVMKLMAKRAEKRYQSAWGLKADLEECLKQWQTTGEITSFPLGRQDKSDRFQIPQKLYGRKEEIKTLLTVFEKVASAKKNSQAQNQTVFKEILLVTGYSGIGKSALVREIYKPITKRRGYFIAGKFDQFKRNVPYSAIVEAFKTLIKQLLSESTVELNQWREKLLQALGVNAGVIIDVIPEIELITGKQPTVAILGTIESQNRFNLVFQKFMQVFCQPEHPLVIFLDDLQWVDSATLNLIRLMNSDSSLQHLFLIGAYRDNEIDSTHPLITTLATLQQKQKLVINRIHLTPLPFDCIVQLIAETLHHPASVVEPLAQLVIRKTSGNPFFVNQFLKTLYAENLLTFNLNSQSWQWDINQIEALDITDNVVELMIAKIHKLPLATQQILVRAACIGTFFDLNTLSIIWQKPSSEVFKDLIPAIQSDLIFSTSSSLDSQLLIQEYKFSHDRIQQVAYSLIDDSQRQIINLQIGRLLLAKLGKQESLDRIFELVDNLNLGRKLIHDQSEKNQLINLNSTAALKAKQTMAYTAAQNYLNVAICYLNDRSWSDDYQRTFKIYQQKSEIEYLKGNYQQAEELIYLLLEKAKSPLEKANSYNALILLYTMLAKYPQAIEAGRKGLALLGIDLNTGDLSSALTQQLQQAQQYLQNLPISALLNQPEMQLPEQKKAVELLMNLLPPAYFTDENLFALISTISSNLCFQYGVVCESAMAYSCYATILIVTAGDYNLAYELGLVALKISDRFNDSSNKAKACHILANHIIHWIQPSKNAQIINEQGYQAALESGNIQSAGYIAHHIINHKMFEGEKLESIAQVLPSYLQFVEEPKNIISYNTFTAHQLAIANLTGKTQNKLSFDYDSTSERQYLQNAEQDKDEHSLCIYYVFKAQILYLYEEYNLAWEALNLAKRRVSFVACLLPEFEYYFYSCLILLALYHHMTKDQQKEYWSELGSNLDKIKMWQKNCPQNFRHKYLLIKAESARVQGLYLEAIDLYDQAIACASKNGFKQDEAIANELAAKFWLTRKKSEIAQLYFKKAYYGYQLWGAKSKLQHLKINYPKFAKAQQRESNLSTITSITSETSNSNNGSIIDFKSVIRASQALAGEIVLDKLLTKLIKIVIENAGAQKSVLILKNKNQWFIEAEGKVDDNQVEVLQSIPVDLTDNQNQNTLLSTAIVNYVIHSSKSVVLNDAINEKQFNRDQYIMNFQPKSILCTPLLNQGKINGILYLENNLATEVFTPERVEILQMICQQGAISIENSRLYKELESYNQILEQKVAQRTQKLVIVNEELAQLANLDGLTQIANRRYMDEYLAREWQKSKDQNQPLSLIMFDVDYFKRYNDLYGHQAGDECLIKIAQAVKHVLIRSGDLCARYGGEEFVVILPDTDLQGAIAVANRLLNQIRLLQIPHLHSKITSFLTISIGISSKILRFETDSDTLIANADKALYQAKKEGRNRYSICNINHN